MIGLLRSLARDARGLAVIETALAAPVLALLALGSVQVSLMVARQQELQTGANDAAALALAGWSASADADPVATVKSMITATLGLNDDQVTVTPLYRCGTATDTVTDKSSCDPADIVTSYVEIDLTDTYTPIWVSLGISQPINYHVSRMVLVS